MLYCHVSSFVVLCCVSVCLGAAVFRRNEEDKRLEVRAARRVHCTKSPGPLPTNVFRRECHLAESSGKCTSTCSTGYRFPDGKFKKTVMCKNGQWSSDATIDCEILERNPDCMDRPGPMPTNVFHRECQLAESSGKCTFTCSTGYQFPDGTFQKTVMCRNGQWSSDATIGCEFEERNPIYTGSCLAIPEAPEMGSTWSCSRDESKGSCQFFCDYGFLLPNGEREIRVNCTNGHWSERVPDACAPQPDYLANVTCIYLPPKPSNLQQSPQCETKRRRGNCNARCQRGYIAPDGTRNAKASCRRGHWTTDNWVCMRRND